MVNFCYAYPIIYDNDGKPLRGRLDFCEPGTTTSKNVKDVNGASLGSSIETTIHGFPGENEIFIDGATDCRVYNNANELQYVMRLVDPTSNVSYPSGSIASVGSIEELRGLTPPVDGSLVTVTGYYDAGDMTPQEYVYSTTATAQDDGGGCIKPEEATTTGRWLLVPKDRVDCRAFGIMPFRNVETIDKSYSLTDFFSYVDSVGRDAWFPAIATSSDPVYPLTNGTYTSHTKVFVDKGVHFRNSAAANSVTLVSAGIESAGFKFDFGVFVVNVPVFRTSWIGTATVNYSNAKKIVVDSDSGVDAVGAFVEFIETVNHSVNLEDCEIVCNGKLSTSYAHSFTDCYVTDRYFTNPSNVNLNLVSLSGCRFDIGDFESVSNWANFEMKQGNGVLDFRGKGIDSLTLSISACGISNASIGSVSIQDSVANVLFKNCAISSLSGSKGNVVLDRCATILTNLVTVAGSLSVIGGSLSGSGVACASAVLDGGDISAPITTKTANAYGCRISQPVVVQGIGNVFTCIFDGNIFTGSGTCSLQSSSGATANSCIWKDNYFGGAAMGVNLAHFDNENTHTYYYEGNFGNCLPKSRKNIAASAKSVTPMTKGWKINVTFPTTELFILGKKDVQIVHHAHVMQGCTLESVGYHTVSTGHSVDVTAPSGGLNQSALVFHETVTESPFNIDMMELAEEYPNSIQAYADIEVL